MKKNCRREAHPVRLDDLQPHRPRRHRRALRRDALPPEAEEAQGTVPAVPPRLFRGGLWFSEPFGLTGCWLPAAGMLNGSKWRQRQEEGSHVERGETVPHRARVVVPSSIGCDRSPPDYHGPGVRSCPDVSSPPDSGVSNLAFPAETAHRTDAVGANWTLAAGMLNCSADAFFAPFSPVWREQSLLMRRP